MLLEKINEPKDLKSLSINELEFLSKEIRQNLLKKLSVHGGHVGPNLGIVELTVALHYVFNSPVDKFVFDVSHQSYVHKMLTGRKDAFMKESQYDVVTGYSNPHESEHDFFTIGHTSTSISLACGLAKARDLKKDHENIIALIGDGSLSGGEAYEGLNNAIENGTNMIIIVNDNEMSIAENHGGLYQNLKALRDSNGQCENNFFTALGFAYEYVGDGHDYASLIETFQKVKDCQHPVIVHVHTVKGKGFAPAESHKEAFHYGSPFDLRSGESKETNGTKNYHDLIANYLLEKMKEDQRIVAITAGTPSVLGFDEEKRKQAKGQFVDVGIAEEHAVALASGIAANGAKPIFGVYSTFLSRAYDQIIQDLCINNNPAIILVFAASVYGMNDVTHLGFNDIPMLSHIPNLTYLVPTNTTEYLSMLNASIEQHDGPVAIRVPVMAVQDEDIVIYEDKFDTFKTTKQGSEVAILGLGNFYSLGEEVVKALQDEQGIQATLINPRCVTAIDSEALDDLKTNHRIVVTLEDGGLEGGFGEKIASYYGNSPMNVLTYGIKKGFYDRYQAEELLQENNITKDQITKDIMQAMSEIK